MRPFPFPLSRALEKKTPLHRRSISFPRSRAARFGDAPTSARCSFVGSTLGRLGLRGGDGDAIQSARSGAASLFSSAPRVGAARKCGRSRRRLPLGRRGGGHNCWCCCLVSLPLPAHGFRTRSKSGTPLCMRWRPWPGGPWHRCSLSLRAESARRLLYQEHTRALALLTVKQVLGVKSKE